MSIKAKLSLYRSLATMKFDEIEAPEFLERALCMVVDALKVRIGLLSIGRTPLTDPLWCATHGDSLESLRDRVSTTIMESPAPGELIVTANAMEDPRFSGPSIKRNRIEQVMCAAMPAGVLYLQGRTVPRTFGVEEQEMMQTVVEVFRPLCERLRWEARWWEDPTQVFRTELECSELIGRSRALARVLRLVRQYAPTAFPVLVTGASGTGKSTLARVLHRNSAQRDQPFRSLSCATALTPDSQTELFELLERPPGGTLFLDDIGYLPREAQSRLQALLDDGFRGTRLIASTSCDLDDTDQILPDLRSRLQRLHISLPPLTQRLEDIYELSTHIMCRFAAELDARGGIPISPAAISWLEGQPWEGNIRQLEDVLLRALLNARDKHSSAIQTEHFETVHAEENLSLQQQTQAFKARLIERMLEACDGNVEEVADLLEVHRTTVYNHAPKQLSKSLDKR